MVYSVSFYLCILYFVLFVCCEAAFMERILTVNAFNSIDSLPTPDIVIRAGYQCETHKVITEDGFILGIHRILGNKSYGINKKLLPIILQHGLMDSSADWVISGPKKGLAFLLADKGYDVWLGNSRGNVYSRAHTTLSPDDDKFWNWTWHEMGYYDLPALVDYILDKTNHTQLKYVGHSMGTTMFFVMCSTRPEYNNKIAYMAALAPVAFLTNTQSPVRYLVPFADNFEKVVEIFGHGELALNSMVKEVLKYTCSLTTFQEEVCENLLFLIVGFDSEQLDLKLLPLILGHNPAGVSSKTVVHYAQEIKSGKFCQYDHGEAQNIMVYNSTTPPEYNLSSITVQMSLHYATNDLLATPVDVKHLFQNLHDKVKIFKVNFEKFNHLDFIWGRNVTTLLYDNLFHLLNTKNTISRPTSVSIITQDQNLKVFDINTLLQKKAEPEKKPAAAAPPPKKEESKAAEAKSEPKKAKADAKGKSMFAGIEEKLPGWQAAIVDKLVAVQQFLVKKIGSKK